MTLRIFCSYEGTGSIDSLQLSVLVHAPLTASETSFTVPYISGGSRTPVIVTVTLYSGSGSLPASNTVTILGSYTAATGEPRTCKSVVTLPLCLFCQVRPPRRRNGLCTSPLVAYSLLCRTDPAGCATGEERRLQNHARHQPHAAGAHHSV